MTREQIQRLRQRAYRAFYSRPGYLLRRTLGIRSLHEVAAAWRGARSLLGLWTRRGAFTRDAAGPWGGGDEVWRDASLSADGTSALSGPRRRLAD